MKEPVENYLERKAAEIKKGAEFLLEKTKDWQTIKRYLSNRFDDIKLTTRQQEKLQRYQFIYNQLCTGQYTEREIVTQTQKMYNLGSVQAYDDLNATKEIFSSFININKRFELKIELDIARDARRKCLAINDMKNVAAITKNIIAILSMIEDVEEFDKEAFEAHTIVAQFNPELLGAEPVDMKELLKEINAKRSAKIKIEDLPFEDLKDGESTAL